MKTPFASHRATLLRRTATLLGLCLGTLAAGNEPVSFEQQVWPILEQSCVSCHGLQHYANLRLDSPEGILRGGDLGPVVVPGQPDESSLYVRTGLPAEDFDFMPVDGNALSQEQRQILRRWIAEAASFGSWRGARPDQGGPSND